MKTSKLISTLTAVALLAGMASAQQIGVVGLYEHGTTLNRAAVTDLGCNIQRSGVIADMKGKLSVSLDQPDQFAVLACDSAVLTDSARRTAVAMLSNGGEAIALFEGALKNFEAPASEQDAAGRQYILKLGYYDNADLDARDAALRALDTKAQQREGAYSTESFLRVHSASGVATPDEVVVLYYENAEIADRFRDDNQDILEAIGIFNQAHLDGFSYLIGTATQ